MGFFKPNIRKMQKSQDIQGLMNEVGNRDPAIALEAVNALIGLGLGADLMMVACEQSAWPFWLLVVGRIEEGIPSDFIASPEFSFLEKQEGLPPSVRYAPRFLKPVIQGLKNGTWDVRQKAGQILGNLDSWPNHPPLDPSMMNELLALFESEDPVVRRGAANGLRAIGWAPGEGETATSYWIILGKYDRCVEIGEDAVEQLKEALRAGIADDDPNTAAAIAAALGDIGDPRSADILAKGIEALELPACSEAIEKLPPGSVEKALISILQKDELAHTDLLKRVMCSRSELFRDQLLRQFRNLGVDGKKLAMAVLADAQDERAVAEIVTLLKKPMFKEVAAKALAQLNYQPGDDSLSAEYCIEKGDFEGCIRIGKQAVDPLLKRLDDDQNRSATIYALVRIGAPALKRIRKFLQPGQHRMEMNESLIRILEGIGTPEAIELIASTLNDPYVVDYAANALDNLEWQPTADEAGALYLLEKQNVKQCLALGSPGMNVVRRRILEGDRNIPKEVGRINDRGLREALIGALLTSFADQSNDTRVLIANALEDLGWCPTNDEVGAWYFSAKGDLSACAELGSCAVEPLLHVLKETYDPAIRKMLLYLLADLRDSRTLPVFLDLIEDSDKETRVLAAKALQTLFQSGEINDAEKLEILKVRDKMVAPHRDSRKHTDHAHHFDHSSSVSASDCNTGVFTSHKDIPNAGWGYGGHKDTKIHTDSGIGFDFRK